MTMMMKMILTMIQMTVPQKERKTVPMKKAIILMMIVMIMIIMLIMKKKKTIKQTRNKKE